MSTGYIALIVCALIGTVIGYYIRDKKKEDSALHSMIACAAGAIFVAWLLAYFVYARIILWPVYAVAGALLANYILRASQRSAKN